MPLENRPPGPPESDSIPWAIPAAPRTTAPVPRRSARAPSPAENRQPADRLCALLHPAVACCDIADEMEIRPRSPPRSVPAECAQTALPVPAGGNRVAASAAAAIAVIAPKPLQIGRAHV